MSPVDITVVADAEEAARLVAERLAEQARAGGSIVLTGGSTPRHAYEIAAEIEPDWSRVDIWFSDERCVPPDDDRSNYGMARRRCSTGSRRNPRSTEWRPSDDYEREIAATSARSTSSCSASAPTGTSPRSSRTSRRST